MSLTKIKPLAFYVISVYNKHSNVLSAHISAQGTIIMSEQYPSSPNQTEQQPRDLTDEEIVAQYRQRQAEEAAAATAAQPPMQHIESPIYVPGDTEEKKPNKLSRRKMIAGLAAFGVLAAGGVAAGLAVSGRGDNAHAGKKPAATGPATPGPEHSKAHETQDPATISFTFNGVHYDNVQDFYNKEEISAENWPDDQDLQVTAAKNLIKEFINDRINPLVGGSLSTEDVKKLQHYSFTKIDGQPAYGSSTFMEKIVYPRAVEALRGDPAEGLPTDGMTDPDEWLEQQTQLGLNNNADMRVTLGDDTVQYKAGYDTIKDGDITIQGIVEGEFYAEVTVTYRDNAGENAVGEQRAAAAENGYNGTVDPSGKDVVRKEVWGMQFDVNSGKLKLVSSPRVTPLE